MTTHTPAASSLACVLPRRVLARLPRRRLLATASFVACKASSRLALLFTSLCALRSAAALLQFLIDMRNLLVDLLDTDDDFADAMLDVARSLPWPQCEDEDTDLICISDPVASARQAGRVRVVPIGTFVLGRNQVSCVISLASQSDRMHHSAPFTTDGLCAAARRATHACCPRSSAHRKTRSCVTAYRASAHSRRQS